MSTLRKKMILQMELKGYSQRTIDSYIDCVKLVSVHYNMSPELLTIDQIREYLHEKLVVDKRSRSWLNSMLSAFKLLYTDVLHREWDNIALPRPRREQKLPIVFSKEEVKKIFDNTENLKHRAILMEQCVSLPMIQQLMGHKSLKTTSVYLHVQKYSLDPLKSPLDTL